MTPMSKLTEEELAYLDKMDDVLPTSRAYVRRALAEIRESRAKLAQWEAIAERDHGKPIAGTVEDFESWLRANLRDDVEVERVTEPRLDAAEVEVLRYWRPLIENDSNTQEWRAFLAAIDRVLAQHGGAK